MEEQDTQNFSGIEKYFANVLFLSNILIAAHNPSH